MAESDKERLAELLRAMSEGQPMDEGAEEDAAASEETPAPTPQPPAPPAVQPAAPKKRQAPRPAPVTPMAGRPAVAKPAAAAPVRRPVAAQPKPVARPQPVAAPKPVAPADPVAPPEPVEMVQQEEAVAADEGTDVAMEAPEPVASEEMTGWPTEQPVATPRRRFPTRQQQHLVQTLAFKRTIIPILLTMGVMSLVIVIIGWASGEDSPLIAFRKLYFTIPAVLGGLVLMGFGVLTMFQVKNDMERAMAEGKQQP